MSSLQGISAPSKRRIINMISLEDVKKAQDVTEDDISLIKLIETNYDKLVAAIDEIKKYDHKIIRLVYDNMDEKGVCYIKLVDGEFIIQVVADSEYDGMYDYHDSLDNFIAENILFIDIEVIDTYDDDDDISWLDQN